MTCVGWPNDQKLCKFVFVFELDQTKPKASRAHAISGETESQVDGNFRYIYLPLRLASCSTFVFVFVFVFELDQTKPKVSRAHAISGETESQVDGNFRYIYLPLRLASCSVI